MAVHLTRIYTKTGDDGTTALGDMSRVRKTSVRVAAYADREVIAAMARHRGDTCFRLQADLDQAREGLRAIDCMDGRPGIDVGGHIGPETDDVQLGFFRFRHGGTSERKAICTNISAQRKRVS